LPERRVWGKICSTRKPVPKAWNFVKELPGQAGETMACSVATVVEGEWEGLQQVAARLYTMLRNKALFQSMATRESI
jgi:hypothetical protein